MNKIIRLLFRYYRAKKLGFNFRGISSFKIPKSLSLNGKEIKLSFPDEKGVFIDFVSIFLDDDYNLSRIKTKKISTIVDIGANVGFFSIAARLAFPNAKIFSYEPNNQLKRYLHDNFRELNIELQMNAVSKNAGRIELENCGDSNQSRVVINNEGSVEMCSLETVIEKVGGQIDLLKMDCEGSEWSVLEDSKLLEKINNITFEYHLWANGESHSYPLYLLRKSGFKIIDSQPSTDFGIITATRC